MAANKLRLTGIQLLRHYNFYNSYSVTQKCLYCTQKAGDGDASEIKKLGFAEFAEKQEEFLKPKPRDTETFVTLLKNSSFVALGNPIGKVVEGEIYHVVGNDLYIDFGWKFSTVCPAPAKNKQLYKRGAKVKLMIKDLELTTKFLGSDTYITLNEADCLLLGLSDDKSHEKM